MSLSQRRDATGAPITGACPCAEVGHAHVHAWTLACPCGVLWSEGWPDVIEGPLDFVIPPHNLHVLPEGPCPHVGQVVRAQLLVQALFY